MNFLKSFFLWVTAVMVFAGCVPAELRLRELPEDPTAPVTVAALLPLTGSNRIYAEQMKEGILAAESRINNFNGISGRPLKVIFCDTGGSASGTREALLDAEKNNAIAIIAGYGTQEVSMITAHADRLQMPMVIPLATSDYHVQSSAFVYRNCFSDLQQMEVLAHYLLYWRKLKRGAVINDQHGDGDYSRGICRNFIQAMRDLGCTISGQVTVGAEKELSDEEMKSLLMAEPEFIMLASGGKRAAAMIKKIRQSGFTGFICGPESWDDQELTSALKGFDPGECIFTAFFDPDNTSREFREFSREFRKRFYHNPGACETQSYDALIFLAIGLENAGDLFAFDRNWRKIRGFTGAAAVYTMQKKGMLDRTVYLKRFSVERLTGPITPKPVLSKKMQYSKLQDYRIIE